MTPERYVQLLADLLSGDPRRMRAANRELYGLLVPADGANPDLVLVDVEQQLAQH